MRLSSVGLLFLPNFENVLPLFLKIFFFPNLSLFSWNFSYTNVRLTDIFPHSSEVLLIYFLFFLCMLQLDSSYCLVFKFTDLFSCSVQIAI